MICKDYLKVQRKNEMFKYSIRQSGVKVAHPFNVSLSFLQGVYSAWLYSSASYIKSDPKNDIAGELWNGGFDKYMITLKRVDTCKESLVSEQLKTPDREVPYINHDIVASAFEKAIVFPISFCWSLPLVYNVGDLNPILLPYHVVPNFSSPYVSLKDSGFLRNLLTTHNSISEDAPISVLEDLLFSSAPDQDLCRKAIGITPNGLETFLVKIPLTANEIDFLKGFIALYRWYYQDSVQRRVATYNVPVFYVYDYGKDVLLRICSRKDDLNMPKIIDKILVKE